MVLFESESENNRIEEIESIADLVKIPDNIEETNYNFALLKYGESLDSIMRENLLSKKDIKNVLQQDKDELLLSDLIKKNSLTFESAWKLKYQGIEYKPIIYIPNKKIALYDLSPIIALGCEIEDVDREDVIPGWYYDETGKKVFVKINKEFAQKSKRPILIINGTTPQSYNLNSANKEIQKNENININKNTKTNPVTKIDEYSINYRYDKSSRSEYSYKLI